MRLTVERVESWAKILIPVGGIISTILWGAIHLGAQYQQVIDQNASRDTSITELKSRVGDLGDKVDDVNVIVGKDHELLQQLLLRQLGGRRQEGQDPLYYPQSGHPKPQSWYTQPSLANAPPAESAGSFSRNP